MAASISKSGRPLIFVVAAFLAMVLVIGLVNRSGPVVTSSNSIRRLDSNEVEDEGGGDTVGGEASNGGQNQGTLMGKPFISLVPMKNQDTRSRQEGVEIGDNVGQQKWPQDEGEGPGGDVGQQKVQQTRRLPPQQILKPGGNNAPPSQEGLQSGGNSGQQVQGGRGKVNLPGEQQLQGKPQLQNTDLTQQQLPGRSGTVQPQWLQLGEDGAQRISHGEPQQSELGGNPVQQLQPVNPAPPAVTDIPVSTIPPLPTFYPSKDLFVRAVHFDGRPRDGHHNTSVFLVVCLKAITDNNLIQGCQVDGKAAKEFSVKLIGETPLWRAFYPHINHEEVMVHCYDLPARNGSTGHIMYLKTADSALVLAASERPLLVPAPRIDPTSKEGKKYNMTIVACAKIFGHPPWLEKWLTYQRTLGVDHVHLDAEDDFQHNGDMQKLFVSKLMAEGFLSVDIWKKYLEGSEIWYHNQGLIYEDCPYRFRGTYDYIMMMDTDDFFMPRVPTEKKIHYYINRFCRGKGIGSCKFRWVEYYPDAVGINESVSIADGNVTRALNNYSHYNQGNPKSLHRTTVLIDTATHYAYLMMPGYEIVKVSVNDAYVAHVRLYKRELPKPGQGLVVGLPNTCSEHLLSKLLLFVLVKVFMVLFS